MTAAPLNQLTVDLDKCIGCWACIHVCPADLITFADENGRRTINFTRICQEDCSRCADVCPEKAITLTPAAEIAIEDTRLTATFDLLKCQRCDAPFTTARIVDRLLEVIPPELQTDESGLSWICLCPDCRQLTEGERMAKEWIMSRWPGEYDLDAI